MDIFLSVLTTIIVIYFLFRLYKFENNFKTLLNIVGGLKFRIFEHEAQLLGRKGVYVPEDTAEYIFNIIWSTVSNKERSQIEKEYKGNCPNHIPLWKYVLYNYQINTKLIPKEPFMKIDTPEEILLGDICQLEQSVKELKKIKKITSEIINSITNMPDESEDITNKIDEKTKNN